MQSSDTNIINNSYNTPDIEKLSMLVEYAINAIGLCVAFNGMISKINKALGVLETEIKIKPTKVTVTSEILTKKATQRDILYMLLQSISIGFENEITKISTSYTEPTPLKNINPTIQLQNIHSRTQQSIFKIENCYQYFRKTFNEAFAEQEKKIKDMEKYSSGLFSGDDFIFAPTENITAIGKRLRTIGSHGKYSANHPPSTHEIVNDRGALTFVLYNTLDYIPAYVFAITSTTAVAIDVIGRDIGKTWGRLVVFLFGFLPSNLNNPTMIIYVEQIVLGCLYFCRELNALWSDVGKAFSITSDYVYTTTFYPIFSGIMIGLYEEIAENYPNALPSFKEKIEKKEKDDKNIDSTPSYWQQAISIVKSSIQEGRHDFEKYDKEYFKKTTSDQRLHGALVKNIPTCKKFLEGRRALFLIMDNSTLSKYQKEALLFLRAGLLILQLGLSKTLFLASKYGTKAISNLAKYITKSFGHQPLEPEQNIALPSKIKQNEVKQTGNREIIPNNKNEKTNR